MFLCGTEKRSDANGDRSSEEGNGDRMDRGEMVGSERRLERVADHALFVCQQNILLPSKPQH